MHSKSIFLLLFHFVFLTSCMSGRKNLDFQPIWPSDTKKVSKKWAPDHDGIDFKIPTGTPIYASHSGVVIAAQYSKSYGYYIIIELSDKWASLYAHLSKLLVKRGDQVQKRQKIGLSGNSGISSGDHLHFEIIKNKIPVNPLKFLPKEKILFDPR